jgi:hypothetical protein
MQTLPAAPVEIIEPYLHFPRAELLRDGTPALFYELEEGVTRTLMRWSEAAGSSAVTELRSRSFNPLTRYWPQPDWTLAPTGVGSDVLVAYVRGNELLTRGLASDALPALSWSELPSGCDATDLVPYPDICSKETADEPAGEQWMAHRIALGVDDSPYLVSVVGQADRHCEWQDPNGCIETMTCECTQLATLDFRSLELDVRALESAAARGFRLPLPNAAPVMLATASRSDGIVVAAVAYGEGPRRSAPTHVRFYGIDTR